MLGLYLALIATTMWLALVAHHEEALGYFLIVPIFLVITLPGMMIIAAIYLIASALLPIKQITSKALDMSSELAQVCTDKINGV